jgi:hypothetical protein
MTLPPGLDQQQLRNIAASHGEERNKLIHRYLTRNGRRLWLSNSRQARTNVGGRYGARNPKRSGLSESSETRTNLGGRYGAGTGRGELPSLTRIRAADKNPTLLEQLRRDGCSDSEYARE